MSLDLPPERIERIRRVAASSTPTELLLEALRVDEQLTESLLQQTLDRVPDTDLQQIIDAVIARLPTETADALALLLALQAPEQMAPYVDDLSEPPLAWPEADWDGERPLVLLPAHHIVLHDGSARSAPVLEQGVRIGHSEHWPALMGRDPTRDPAAPAIATGEIGGPASGACLVCGEPLQRVIDFGSFPGTDDGSLPSEAVACASFGCLWEHQHFAHDDEQPQPLPRTRTLEIPEVPKPRPIPVVPVSFHPTPPRWALQAWGYGQNINRVGGSASWIQDAIHPDCPRCDRPMPFLAQLDGSTPFEGDASWGEWTHGLLYVFWCRDCRVSAVTTQQT